MFKLSFIILHYLTLDETIECIESIINMVECENYEIIVVDNGSENNTGKILHDKYSEVKNVTVILNSENLGYARGNNIGYTYARNNLKSDFVIIINNDTIIRQKDFVYKLVEKYQEYPYHILGPDIISEKTGEHQNPRKETLTDIETIRRFNRHYRFFLFLNYFNLDLIVERIKKKFIPVSKLPTSIDPELNPENREMKQVKLHGSALVFSPLYIERYENAFHPETFMYCEESILYFIAQRDQLKTIYSPKIKIYHFEDSSTNSFLQKDYLKRRFYYKNFIKSSKVLIKLMKQDKV